MLPDISPSRLAAVPFDARAARPGVKDGFGNLLDEETGYARGRILRSHVEEMRRFNYGQRLAAERLRLFGETSIGVFGGHAGDFSLSQGDTRTWCEEWLGPSRMERQFQNAARLHLGGDDQARAALFNRTSAGIITAIAALAGHGTVMSLLPPEGRSHASVRRGAALANARLHEYTAQQNWQQSIERVRPDLVVITPVTSDLDILRDDGMLNMIQIAHAVGAVVLVDDAYGARLRPALCDGVSALSLGADLVITSCDKAGLHGPRAGLMVGDAAAITTLQARSREWGMDARAPTMAGVLRALQAYTSLQLISESACGKRLAEAVSHELGAWVRHSPLGVMLDAEDLLRYLLMQREIDPGLSAAVPCEASAAVGMILLREFGILTAHSHGDPGGSAALHLKPTSKSLARTGGIVSVVQALRESLKAVAAVIDQEDRLRELILGE